MLSTAKPPPFCVGRLTFSQESGAGGSVAVGVGTLRVGVGVGAGCMPWDGLWWNRAKNPAMRSVTARTAATVLTAAANEANRRRGDSRGSVLSRGAVGLES